MAEKKPVLGTGLSGLVGTKIVEMLSDEYAFINLDRTEGIDILDANQIEDIIARSPAKTLLHLAAFTDLNTAQKEAGDTSGVVYQVNVEGTRNIAEACARHGVHLIHLSTGYVFDGTKETAYLETDATNPIDWYAETKLAAEKVIAEVIPTATIFRINFPYRQDEFAKPDIWHKIAQALQAGKTGPFFSDHFFTLTPIEWFAEVIRWAIEHQPTGIFHATSDTVYSDFSLAEEIRDSLGLTQTLQQSSVHTYNETADRPYAPSLILNNDKLNQALKQTNAQTSSTP